MIYFDNAATSYPKPPVVFEAMSRFMNEAGGNPGRSGHRMATAAEAMLVEARNAISKHFGCKSPERCVFTYNCTDALNIAIKGVLRGGEHAISSVLEHNSVNRPLQILADEGGVELHRVGADETGSWLVDEILSALKPHTRLVAVTHCSNVLGVLCPVEELGRALRAKRPDVLLLVDAAQTSGVVPLNIEQACIDFLAIPGHKGLMGPPGTGALLIGSRVADSDIGPWREGGTGGDSASPHQPREWPHYLEGGTPNTMGIAGLLAGLRYVQDQGQDHVLSHERRLQKMLMDEFLGDERFTLFGTTDIEKKVGVLSLTIRDRDTAEVATILDQAFETCVRPGLHCAPYTHQAIGTFPTGTIRLSPGLANTTEDVHRVVAALKEIAS